MTDTKDIITQIEQLRFLNDVAHDLINHNTIDYGMAKGLRRILDYFLGDRIYVFEYDNLSRTASNTYEVCAEGVSPLMDSMQKIGLDVCPFWHHSFTHNSYVLIEDVNALGSDREVEKQSLMSNGVRSAIAVALRSGDDLIGFIGINNPTRNMHSVDDLITFSDFISVNVMRRQMRARIDFDNKQLKKLISDMPGGYARVRIFSDGASVPVYVNNNLVSMLGYDTREQALSVFGKNAYEPVHPDDMPVVQQLIRDAFSDKGETAKYRLQKKNGEYLWVSVSARMTVNENGEKYLNAYYTDISASVILETKRKALLENLPCGAGIYLYKDKKLTAEFLNERYTNLVGISNGDTASLSALDIVHPKDRKGLTKALQAGVGLGQNVEHNARILCADKEYRKFHIVANIAKRQNDVLIYAIYIPLPEAPISFAEMVPVALEAMMASADDYAFVKDVNLTYLCCSRTFAELVGLKDAKDIIGKTDYDLFDTKIANKFRADDKRVISSGQSMVNNIESVPDKLNSHRIASTSKYLLKDSMGSIVGIYGISRDVTETKEAYERLKFLTDTMPGCIAICAIKDNDILPVYMSSGFYEYTGYSEEEFKALSSKDPLFFSHHDDRVALIQELFRVVEDGQLHSIAHRIYNKAGELRWWNIECARGESQGDSIIVHIAAFDITDIKNADLDLETSHRALELAVKNCDISFWMFNLDTREINQSFSAQSPLGYTPIIKNVPESLHYSNEIAPEHQLAHQRMYDKLYGGEKSSECTIKVLDHNTNQYVWRRMIYTRLPFDVYGERLAIGSSSNVDTEQENRMRYEYESQLRRLLVKDCIYYYQLNLTTRRVEEYVSKYDDMPGMYSNKPFDKVLQDSILHNVAPEFAHLVHDTLMPYSLSALYEQGTTAIDVEYRRNIPGQGMRWVKATGTIIKKPHNNEVVAFIYLTDIDEAKKDSLAIESILRDETESIIILELDTGIARALQDREELVGYIGRSPFRFDDVFGKTVEKLIIEEDQETCLKFFFTQNLKAQLALDGEIKIAYRIKGKNEELYCKTARATYLDGTKKEAVIVRHNITDVYLAEQEQKRALQNAVDATQKAMQAKEDFLSRMSHDMRTPLSAVMSFSSTYLTADANPQQLREYLGKIYSSSEQLLTIINDILDMSKIEQKKMTLNPTEYTLEEFIGTMNTIIGELCKNKEIEFVIDAEGADKAVYVDKLRFNQIFINLLSNAVKFTPSGGKVELIVRNLPCEKGLTKKRLIVRDNGIGMSEDFLPFAFDTFAQEYRGDALAQSQGTGLGLSIVHDLVQLMGGTVKVESKIGKGTTFTVDLPMDICKLTTQEQTTDDNCDCPLKGARILLCDDNLLNTEIAVKLLEKKGCIVTSAMSGQGCIDAFCDSPIDHYKAILMDIRMPVMNGLEATTILRGLPREDAKTIPIIAMTADTFDSDTKLCMSVGMNAHIGKPINPQKFYETISVQINQRARQKNKS